MPGNSVKHLVIALTRVSVGLPPPDSLPSQVGGKANDRAACSPSNQVMLLAFLYEILNYSAPAVA